MKQIVFIVFLFSSLLSSAQFDSLQIGDTWRFENAYIRDADYSDYPNDPAQLHDLIFYEGFAKVTYNGKIGFIDKNKTIVIPLVYAYGLGANKFVNSRSMVVQNTDWGVIDTSGKEIIPLMYGRIRQYESLFHVTIGNQFGYFDFNGKTILPVDYHWCSPIMPKEDVYKLAAEYYKRDSLENSVPITKNKAIAIAKKEKHYLESDFPFIPTVELDTTSYEWIIKSSKFDGVTREGDCANTNGCSVFTKVQIVIDAKNGKVIRKSKYQTQMPNWE